MIISIFVNGKTHGHFEVSDVSEEQEKKIVAQMERDLTHYAVGIGKPFKQTYPAIGGNGDPA